MVNRTADCFPTREAIGRAVTESRATVPKADLIVNLCAGKSVLDVGCVDHSLEEALSQGGEWLHAKIVQVAREAAGLDVLEEAAKELSRRGYRILAGDAESFDLGRTFDVIVAADIIEHLSNPGMLLEAAKRHMQDDSLLVVTTPNPFNAEFMLRAMSMGRVDSNPTHSQWFDPRTLYTLLDRHGFTIKGFHWIDTRFHFPLRPESRLRNRVLNWFASVLFSRRPVCRRDFAFVCMKRKRVAANG